MKRIVGIATLALVADCSTPTQQSAFVGAWGDVGATGNTGMRGERGARGEAGYEMSGPAGVAGPTGVSGIQGGVMIGARRSQDPSQADCSSPRVRAQVDLFLREVLPQLQSAMPLQIVARD